MGNSQSKTQQLHVQDAALTEKLTHRLRALELEKAQIVVDDYANLTTPLKPFSAELNITSALDWQKELLSNPKNRLALSAFSSNAARDILISRSAQIADQHIFNIKIPHEGQPVTNQRSSGRCWLFASSNVFRIPIMQRYNLKELELSQAYLFFWDKLEKANYFLESILDTLDDSLDTRLVQQILKAPVNDGGQWDMVANLVMKYGLVPHQLYPDAYNAMNSALMGSLITTKLREDAVRLRTLANGRDVLTAKKSLAGVKDKMLQEISGILTLMLGPPPSPTEKFTWEFYDADGKFKSLTMTPISFAHQLSDAETLNVTQGTDVHKLFSLVNDPRHDYNTHLTVSYLGNVYGGRPITYVNVDMATMKAACIAMLKRGLAVFFGSDVGKHSNSQLGVMDTALYDFELGFNVKFSMSKGDRLRTRESSMTHAMVLTAVHLDTDGNPVRWRVENSWGSENVGDGGYMVMTDAWMDEFVYQAVVDPAFVSEETRKVLDKDPIVLPPWDPMGALACKVE
jgi:bleomycin hydrolase